MKRTRKTKSPADAILVSDLHLTDSTPVSRTDDYITAQICKLQFLQSLSAKNNNCPILCAGDVFDHWKASPWLCSMAFNFLPRPFIGIPGQHDLPEHSLEELPRSALSLLGYVDSELFILTGEEMEYESKFQIVGLPFGKLKKFDVSMLKQPLRKDRVKVMMLHELTWKSKRPSWDKGSWTDLELINEFGEYFDLILTGDNHGGFVTKHDDCLLVNPGSMLRKTADQEDYKPRCYLYYADLNDVFPVHFPVEKNVHTREHIDRKKEHDERITAYISRMKENWEIGLSFRKNLEAFFAENNTPKKVREIICQAVEAKKN